MRGVYGSGHNWSQSVAGATVILALLSCASCTQDDGDKIVNESNEWIEQIDQDNARKFSGNADFLVLPGLIADRKHQYVELYATASGQGADVAIDVLIAPRGDEEIDPLAVSFAGPREVQEALEFIGMTAGYPLDVDQVHHWPKGERVTVSFSWGGPSVRQPEHTVRAEHLLLDAGWSSSLPELGFRFVGAAHTGDDASGFILTTFNARNTVLESPYIVARRTLSGRLFENPEFGFEAGQQLRIRLRPEFRNERKRVADFVLDIQRGDGGGGESLSELAVTLAATPDMKNEDASVAGNFEDVFVYLQQRIKDGTEPYLAVQFDDALPVASVKNIARFFRQFLIPQQVRFEPVATQLFYSAFLPNENWRDPSRRQHASQPVEVHWSSNGEPGFSGSIVQHPLPGDAEQPPTERVFANREEFVAVLHNAQPWNTDALFMFVDATVRYGQVREVYEIVRRDFPNVYVFL